MSLPIPGIPRPLAFAAPEKMSSHIWASHSTAHRNSDLFHNCAKWT